MKLQRTIHIFICMLPVFATAQDVHVDLDAKVVSVASGGFWSQGGVRGTYRIVVSNSGFEHVVSQVIVQRVTDSASPAQGPSVISEQELVSPGLVSFGLPKLEFSEAVLRVTLSGVISSDPTKEVSCVFEMVADGTYKEVKPCG